MIPQLLAHYRILRPLETVGHAVEPPKTIVCVPQTRVANLVSAREVPVSLGGHLLSAECLVLVPFEDAFPPEG
ncbi:MAG: hypothetical protein JJE40_09960 [Vicinamibacteria bacterium]|nr:hypothetical protein [Vicinamibacteria bacterium]